MRFDTYRGCSHGCRYCFAARKRSLSRIELGEGTKSLRDWIKGQRALDTRWCDWRIPLHWGGMSDPFQPAERKLGLSRACLEILAATRYPVVISTKGTELLCSEPYRELLGACNAAVQISMVSRRLDALERGAPSFALRLRSLASLSSACRRLIIRIQPYQPEFLLDVMQHFPCYTDAGVYGVTVEGLKLPHRAPGLVKLGGDFVYPADVLRAHFEKLRDACHRLGLKFFAAENRLRGMGDDPTCCCGVADLPGFRVSKANLSALTVPGGRLRYTARMQQRGTAWPFRAIAQNVVGSPALRRLSFAECMEIARRVPAFREAMGLTG